MRIGIVSDTHGHVEPMRLAIALLRDAGAQFFIHCGDVGSESVLDQLAGLPSAFVFGNCDYDRMALQRYAREIGVQCLQSFGELELGGMRVAVIHGDDHPLKHGILQSQRHDVLLQGHTHVPADVQVGRIRCINPGALYRAREKTAAMLETDAGSVQMFSLAD